MNSSSDNLVYGPELPANISQESDEFTSPFRTTSAAAASEELYDSATGSFTSAYAFGKKLLTKVVNPGRQMSYDEWKNSDYYFPTSANKGPISENVAKIDKQRYEDNFVHQTILAGAPQNLTTSFSTTVAGYIGFMLNPVNTAGFTGASMIVGKASVSLLNALEETSLATSQLSKANQVMLEHIGKGAAIGALGFTPDVGSRYATDAYLDQNPDGLSAIATIGMGAGLGGIVGSITGTLAKAKLPITDDAFKQMRETAVEQASNGKTVNVDPIIQDGYRRARAAETPLTDAEKAAISAKKEKLEAQTSTLRDNLEEAKKKEVAAKAAIKESPEALIAYEKARDEVLDTNRKAFLKSTMENWKAGEQLGDLEAFQLSKELERQRKTGERAPIAHHTELDQPLTDRQLFDELRNKDDPVDLKKYEEVKEKMAKEKLERDTADIKARWEKGEYLSDREKFEFSRHKRIMSQKALDAHIEEIANHEAIEVMDKNRGTPVDTEDVIAASNKVNSWEGDASINKNDLDAFDKKIEEMPEVGDHEEALTKEEQKISRLDDQGLLKDEHIEALEDAEKLNEKGKKYENYLKMAANCLKGGK